MKTSSIDQLDQSSQSDQIIQVAKDETIVLITETQIISMQILNVRPRAPIHDVRAHAAPTAPTAPTITAETKTVVDRNGLK